jgi:hypothetical protein
MEETKKNFTRGIRKKFFVGNKAKIIYFSGGKDLFIQKKNKHNFYFGILPKYLKF